MLRAMNTLQHHCGMIDSPGGDRDLDTSKPKAKHTGSMPFSAVSLLARQISAAKEKAYENLCAMYISKPGIEYHAGTTNSMAKCYCLRSSLHTFDSEGRFSSERGIVAHDQRCATRVGMASDEAVRRAEVVVGAGRPL